MKKPIVNVDEVKDGISVEENYKKSERRSKKDRKARENLWIQDCINSNYLNYFKNYL